MNAVWIILVAVVLLGLLSGGKSRGGAGGKRARIDHPHVIDPDDYECPVCGARFEKDVMTCPRCGARFTGKTTDTEEFDEEEDEMEAWDEEDGI